MPLRLDLPPEPQDPGRADFGAGPGPDGTTTRRRAARSRRRGGPSAARVALATVAALGLAVGGGVAMGHISDDDDAVTTAAADVEVLIPLPAQARLAGCFDRSYGMHRIGTQAIRAAGRAVLGYGAETAVLRSEPLDAVPGLDVQLRVVRPDSYVTTDEHNSGVTITVPGIPGLATAEPAVGSPGKVIDAYEAAYQESTDAVAAARAAQRRAHPEVSRLSQVLSEGSDITGCLFAQARDTGGAPYSALVVSDFGDTGLTHDDGTTRGFAGDLSQARLTVVATCAGSDPARCEEEYQSFLERARGFGLDVDKVTRYGPNQLDEASHRWLQTGLSQAVPATD